MMKITYKLGDKLYINMTNRCSNACDFCIRAGEAKNVDNWQSDRDLVGTDKLWLDREPDVDEVIDDLKKWKLDDFEEVVFCGFGEPFMRFDDCREVAKWLKSKGIRVRVNTNGQANLVHNRDVTFDMIGIFDEADISLNAENAEKYDAICHSDYGTEAYNALLDFAKGCIDKGIKVKMSVVDTIGEEAIEKCRAIASSCGATLRVRELIE